MTLANDWFGSRMYRSGEPGVVHQPWLATGSQAYQCALLAPERQIAELS